MCTGSTRGDFSAELSVLEGTLLVEGLYTGFLISLRHHPTNEFRNHATCLPFATISVGHTSELFP